MSAGTFNLDTVTLIELVEGRSCLWDKFADGYKDKIPKRNAWKEVFEFLEPDFNAMDDKEQKKIGDMILTKWNKIRDEFIRSLKTKSGQSAKKRYIYYNQLQFLLKIAKMDSTISSITPDPGRPDDPKHTDASRTKTAATHSGKPFKKSRMSDRNVEQEMINFLSQKEEIPAPPDEDETFFMSILPAVRKMNELDKFDFRLDVMGLIKKNRKRKGAAGQQTYFTPALSSQRCNTGINSPDIDRSSTQDGQTMPSGSSGSTMESQQIYTEEHSPKTFTELFASINNTENNT